MNGEVPATFPATQVVAQTCEPAMAGQTPVGLPLSDSAVV